MTSKEELERIETAYYSGLKVQIWFNGIWYDYDARECRGFSEYRQYRIVGSDYAKKAEEKIKKLEEQIEEMKSDVKGNIRWADQNKNEQMYCKLNVMFNQWEIKKDVL